MQLNKSEDSKNDFEKEKFKEDRKDERTKIQATQQSALIDQRQKESPPKNFKTEEERNMWEQSIIKAESLYL